MATWIEFRCENRGNPSSDLKPGEHDKRCWSHDSEGPMDMASDTQASVIETLRSLVSYAKASGWVKTKYGWICPYCAAQPTVHDELKAANG